MRATIPLKRCRRGRTTRIAGSKSEYTERMKRCEEQSKLLSKRIDDLNRKQRTHRLRVRAGILESFFTKPELLTDDQVMDVLRLAFRQPEVKRFVAGIEASLTVLQDSDFCI